VHERHNTISRLGARKDTNKNGEFGMKCAIHSANYIPGLSYFDKMSRVDLFVFYDTAIYSGHSFINRNRIKNKDWDWSWLTIPISHDNHGRMLKDVMLPETDWREQHLAQIEEYYADAPHVELAKEFKTILYHHDKLIELNKELIAWASEKLEISTPTTSSVKFHVSDSKRDEAIIEMCQNVGAGEYVFGKGGLGYMDFKKYEDAEIKIFKQIYVQREYSQPGKFTKNMSVIDYIFNTGGKK
jgi:hypothetical protein